MSGVGAVSSIVCLTVFLCVFSLFEFCLRRIETMDTTRTHLTHLLTLHLSHTLTSTHTSTSSDAERLVQMTAINVFSIHHAVDSHTGKSGGAVFLK